MHSVLFRLDPIVIHAYGACLALAILLCYFVLVRLGRPLGYSADFISSLLTVLIIFGLVGARLFFVIEHWAYYSKRPGDIVKVWQGGLMFYGGLIVAAAALGVWIRVNRRPIGEVLDLIVTAVPLGHAIGRVGCFLNGCCYGRLSHACIAVRYPHQSIPWADQLAACEPGSADYARLTAEGARSLPVLPIQLIEAGLNAVVFVILLTLFRRRTRNGAQVAAYMMLYAVVRFVVEFARADDRLHVGPFSIGQVISLALLVGGLVLTGVIRRRPKLAINEATAPETPPH